MKLNKTQRAILTKLSTCSLALAPSTRLGVRQVHFNAGRWFVAQGLASSVWVTNSAVPYQKIEITEAGRALLRELEEAS